MSTRANTCPETEQGLRDRIAELEAALARGQLASDRHESLAEALAMVEERQKLLLESSLDAIVFYDLSGAAMFFNAAFLDTFGLTREGVLGNSVDFIPPDREAEYDALRAGILDGKAVVNLETKRLAAFGLERDVALCAVPYRDRAGNIVGHVEFLRDLTETKFMEDSLDEVRDRYRILMEATPDPIAIYDLSGGISYVNPAFETAFGWRLDECVGSSVENVPVEELERTEQAAALVFEGQSQVFESKRQSRDGSVVEFLISMAPYRSSDGAVVGRVEISKDIAARKQIEREMLRAKESAEEALRAIFENAAEGIYQMSADGRYLKANPALAAYFGFYSGQALIDHFKHGGSGLYLDPARRDELLARLKARPRVRDFESQVRTRDGRLIWISENIRAAYGADGRLDYYEGWVLDITDRRRDEERLKRANAELHEAYRRLQAADEMKTAFLSNISHELLTPLTAVRGFARMLGNALAGPLGQAIVPEQKKAFKAVQQGLNNARIIMTEAERLTGLITNVIDITALESGTVEWRDEPVAVAELVAAALERVDALCREKGLELTLEAVDASLRIHGDKARLVKALANLLHNAVKFTERGTVGCRVRLAAERVLVDVSDTGAGISNAVRSILFEKFGQGGDSLTDKPKGVGLGLAIAHKIIERHGGSIHLASKPGKGSVFSIELPLAEGSSD